MAVLTDRLARAVLSELQDVLQNPHHPLRVAYGERVEDFIKRLQIDPELSRRAHEIKAQVLSHPGVHGYVGGLVQEVKAWLRRDLSETDSRLTSRLAGVLETLGRRLSEDAGLRTSINEHVLSGAGKFVDDVRAQITAHIAQTIKNWDEAKMVREMELSVGKDLQYIRLNGTFVGGLAGAALYAMSHAAWIAGMFR